VTAASRKAPWLSPAEIIPPSSVLRAPQAAATPVPIGPRVMENGIGGFTPLSGFMSNADWKGVCDEMTTASGLFWPIPITLSADKSFADSVRIGQDIALIDPDDGEPL
jgi:hypothetical protein